MTESTLSGSPFNACPCLLLPLETIIHVPSTRGQDEFR
jgi:hypothetical protein